MRKIAFPGQYQSGSIAFNRYSYNPLEVASEHRLDTVLQRLTHGFTPEEVAKAGLGNGVLKNRTGVGSRKRIADMSRAASRGRAAGYTVAVDGKEVGVLSLGYPSPERPTPSQVKQPLTIARFAAGVGLEALHPSFRTLRMYSMWFNNEILEAVTTDPDGLVEEAFGGSLAIADRAKIQTTAIIDSRDVVEGSELIRVAEHEVDLSDHGFVIDTEKTSQGIEHQIFKGSYFERERRPVFGNEV
jgi:hypothetical protein